MDVGLTVGQKVTETSPKALGLRFANKGSMKNRTFKERLEAGLKSLGYREVTGVTRKYTVFVMEGTRKLFVGKSGALRSGNNASSSFSLGDPGNITPTYQRILLAGDKALDGGIPRGPETR